MNSKEALEKLTYCVNGIESKEKYYKIIKQDLDKLEKLEEEHLDLLKECAELHQDLKSLGKLKKVIEILRIKEVSIKWLFYCINLDRYNSLIDEEEYKLTQKEYDLLKDVVGNGC